MDQKTERPPVMPAGGRSVFRHRGPPHHPGSFGGYPSRPGSGASRYGCTPLRICYPFSYKAQKPIAYLDFIPYFYPEQWWIHQGVERGGRVAGGSMYHEKRVLNGGSAVVEPAGFPEVAAGITSGLSADGAVLDGELVVLAGDGRPDFYAVVDRHSQGRAERIRRAAERKPATFMAFDLLESSCRSITDLPLRQRELRLASILRPGHAVQLVESWPGPSGLAAAQAVLDRDLEGLVAKRLDSRYYLDTRSPDWRKLKFWHTAEMTMLALRHDPFGVLVGEPGSPRAMVELGWRPTDRQVLRGLLPDLRDRESDGMVWLKPLLRCQVHYRVTPEGRIREPVFKGFLVEGQCA